MGSRARCWAPDRSADADRLAHFKEVARKLHKKQARDKVTITSRDVVETLSLPFILGRRAKAVGQWLDCCALRRSLPL